MRGTVQRIVVWLLMALVALVGRAEASLNAQNRARLRSPRSQFEALEQSKDCSVYRAVSRRAIGQIEEFQRARTGIAALLKQRFEELQSCGRVRGVAVESADQEEQALAEMCPTEYERALVVNFRLASLQDEMQELVSSHRQLATTLRERCADLPEVAELEQATSGPDVEEDSDASDEGDTEV